MIMCEFPTAWRGGGDGCVAISTSRRLKQEIAVGNDDDDDAVHLVVGTRERSPRLTNTYSFSSLRWLIALQICVSKSRMYVARVAAGKHIYMLDRPCIWIRLIQWHHDAQSCAQYHSPYARNALIIWKEMLQLIQSSETVKHGLAKRPKYSFV